MNLKTIIEKFVILIDSDISVTNIATLNDGDDFLETKSPIVLSIVNIEEDKTQKNQSVYFNPSNDQINISRYNHPTQHLIFSLLFSSYNKDLSKYLDGIDKLKTIIFFFQQNKSFYYKKDDSELIDYQAFLAKSEVDQQNYNKITMEFVSLSTEQLNQMWSCLGSKYMPSALYKMRLFMIQSDTTIGEKVIRKVKIDLWENNKNNPVGLIETQETDN